MRIVHINRDECTGGASRSAFRLHEGLRRLGQDSHMYVANKSTSSPTTKRFEPRQNRLSFHKRNLRRWILKRAIGRYADTSSKDRTFFSDDRTVFYNEVSCQIPPADLINLHWVAEFLDYGAFFDWLPESMHLVWTLHDMSPFTGGCCYDLDCGKFTERCGACPQLGSREEHDLTREVWNRKESYYRGLTDGRFHIVTPSRWLSEQVQRSPLLSRFPRSVIPYGLDLEVFCPRERTAAREAVGIPQQAKVLLFVSQEISMVRKGFAVLASALEGLRGDNIFLCSLGAGRAPAVSGFPQVHIPSVTHDGLLSQIYSAADVFVLPSLADNLPNTMLESIACGTPVVAFAAGGIPDTVRPGITGSLAKTADPAELRVAIRELLADDAKRAEMSANCRKVALAEYSLDLQAKRYIQLYEAMTASATAVANPKRAN